MSEVEKLCDIVGIIHAGRLVAEGTLPELQARYGERDMEEIFVKAVGGEAALAAAMDAKEARP
ncbi:MAG: ABC transporter ATP-binding protein, partial [Bauldia sp.]